MWHEEDDSADGAKLSATAQSAKTNEVLWQIRLLKVTGRKVVH
jgi:hypothetical protein